MTRRASIVARITAGRTSVGIEDALDGGPRGCLTLTRIHRMSFALRQSFGAFAGGVEHAYALATLARATRATPDRSAAAAATDTLLLDDLRQRTDLDPEWRLVALLQDLMSHAGYTLEDLRREGFAETMLDAARALRRLAW